jgi:hypothetical protein
MVNLQVLWEIFPGRGPHLRSRKMHKYAKITTNSAQIYLTFYPFFFYTEDTSNNAVAKTADFSVGFAGGVAAPRS